MSKHTPGPWHAAGNEIKDAANRSIGRALSWPGEAGINEFANARLMAAAPELFDALKLLAPAFYRAMARNGDCGGYLEPCAQAMALLYNIEEDLKRKPWCHAAHQGGDKP